MGRSIFQAPSPSPLGHIGQHLRRRLVAGLLLLIPIAVTYILLRWVFFSVDGLLQPLLRPLFTWLFGVVTGTRPDTPVSVPGAGLVGVLLLVYLLGILAANVVGRYIIHLFQEILLRVPVVNAVYRASKQLVDTLSGPPEAEYKRVVFIEMPMQMGYALGFHTGTMVDETGQTLALVYIPTAPMPNSGWMAIVPLDRMYETDITVGEAMRMVISGGALAPSHVAKARITPPFRADTLRTAPGRDPS